MGKRERFGLFGPTVKVAVLAAALAAALVACFYLMPLQAHAAMSASEQAGQTAVEATSKKRLTGEMTWCGGGHHAFVKKVRISGNKIVVKGRLIWLGTTEDGSRGTGKSGTLYAKLKSSTKYYFNGKRVSKKTMAKRLKKANLRKTFVVYGQRVQDFSIDIDVNKKGYVRYIYAG